MKCALCGKEYNENESGVTCRGCPLAAGCNMVRCPNCGYETPKEPGFLKIIKAWRQKNGRVAGKR